MVLGARGADGRFANGDGKVSVPKMGSITEIESVSIYRLDHERILEQQEKLWLLGPAILMICWLPAGRRMPAK
jgi:hypothetical protein